ncbi:MAG: TrkA family potassium uptake protein [Chloroflexi bacterium]|nr:TrkA family potassium uptake protein [Chloroflexota bacterium]
MTHKYIVVVGCGRLGAYLASLLSGQGHSVVVIDQVGRSFAQLSAEFSGFQIYGDASELDVLRQAKIEQADSVFVTTSSDNINLMVAQVARAIFKVSHVVARVYNPQREAVYKELGVQVINPTQLSANHFLQTIT